MTILATVRTRSGRIRELYEYWPDGVRPRYGSRWQDGRGGSTESDSMHGLMSPDVPYFGATVESWVERWSGR